MRALFAAAFLAAGLAAAAAAAGSLELDGDFVQGGLVLGRTEPGTRILLDGRRVRVAADGRFVFGFHRDAPATAKLVAVFPDGSTDVRTLEVARRAFRVQRIDGLPKRKVTPKREDLERIRAENAMIAETRRRDTPVPYFESGFIWPATGPITGVYGTARILNGEPRQPHYGVDIAAPEGSPVVAPADGVVALVHPDMFFTGVTVILDHGHGLTSAYLHMSRAEVEPGQTVRQGDLIGRVGATGRATGPHLDWRINWFDRRIDPALVAGPMPKPAVGASGAGGAGGG